MIEVRRARDAAELRAALGLREAVFVVEQGVSVEGDRDGRDGEALQLVAVGDDGAVVGTCRVLLEGSTARFGRLVVRSDHRRRGIGARLLECAEREAVAAGAASMELHAQLDAVSLYERAGYASHGPRFVEEGIGHQAYAKRLRSPAAAGGV